MSFTLSIEADRKAEKTRTRTADFYSLNIKDENFTVVKGTSATAFPGQLNRTFTIENVDKEEDLEKLAAIFLKYQ